MKRISRSVTDQATAAAVLKRMQKVDQALDGWNLSQLRYFNKAYIIITSRVIDSLEAGRFDEPETMNRLDGRFGWYYFDPLARHLRGQKVVRPWLRLFSGNHGSSLRLLALGVNAHVNLDLPLAMLEAGVNKVDFFIVNELIDQTAEEILRGLAGRTLFDKLVMKLTRPFAWLTRRLMRRWRRQAWRNYQRLLGGRLTKPQLEKRVSKLADRIASSPIWPLHLLRF